MLGLASGCGDDAFTGQSEGDTSSTTTPGNTTNPVTGASVASIQLLTSSPSLGSSPTDSVTISAIVKDTNNNLMQGVDVIFSSNDGDITTTQPTTSATGVASASLTTASDPSNRTITVRATAGTITSTIDVAVTGTELSIGGLSSLVINSTSSLTIVARDSDGQGLNNQTLNVTSSNTNAVTVGSPTVTTTTGGQATLAVNAVGSGNATITVSGLGATATIAISVTAAQFTMTFPGADANGDLEISVYEQIQVEWLNDAGSPETGQTIVFSSTRGTFFDGVAGSPTTSAVTDGAGIATIYIFSNNAGPADIGASTGGGPSVSENREFIATAPDSLSIQADRTTIGPNGEQATLTAVVRDSDNNLVKNIDVRFSIVQDNSGGQISDAISTSDSQGRATSIYTSSSATTARDGVLVQAKVDGVDCATTPDQCDSVYLTVAQNELFVVLGTGNKIEVKDDIIYQYPYTVLVTDSGGNAVANTNVVISLEPEIYATGWNFWVTPFGRYLQHITAKCENEDLNRDGVLDTGEDFNSNYTLEPRNVASAPSIVTTDEFGFAKFYVEYSKQFAWWVNVTLTATAGVAGTESLDAVNFWLPALIDDVTNEDSPPSYVSPFGATSTCDEIREIIPYAVYGEPGDAQDSGILVGWQPVSQALGYNIYRADAGNCPINQADINVTATKLNTTLNTSNLYLDSAAATTFDYCYAVSAEFGINVLDPADTRNINVNVDGSGEGPLSLTSDIIGAP